jgi:hypothetical protein
MATCPNKNLDSWKSLVSSRGEDMAYYLWDKYEGVVPKNEYEVSIKPGVEELFESNQEFANQVYEALGFKTKSLNTLNDLPTLIKNLKEAGFNVNERQSIENSVKTLKQGLDVILLEDGLQGGRLSYNEDTETLDLWFTNGLEKQDNNLRLKAEKIFNGQITPQQKQQALQLYSQYLDTGKQDIENFKKFVTGNTVVEPAYKPIGEESNLQYQFKVVSNLYNNLDKINKLWKQIGNNNTFWNKIQQDFQIPKDQVNLLKESEGNTIEEKLTSFAANYSYTVKINTTDEIKATSYVGNNDQGHEEAFSYKGKDYFMGVELDEDFNPIENSFTYHKGNIAITKKEFEEAYKAANEVKTPTQYYSNLTVPGGTNYTENEIATPEVIPSIEGHAKFATDNGIGWFRSDEQVIEGKKVDYDALKKSMIEQGYDEEDINLIISNKRSVTNKQSEKGIVTKTRRILEVQSDLFQKGRDKTELIHKSLIKGEIFKIGTYPNSTAYGKDEKGFYKHAVGKLKEYITEYEFKSAELNKPNIKENQFLQLLNKDNNWVTFFVKSIIQDSAKKRYEKVLFPSGNTASKVEGHTTLEEFKKQKEDLIKLRESQKTNTPNKKYYIADEKGNNISGGIFGGIFITNIKAADEKLKTYNNPKYTIVEIEESVEELNKNINEEINQLKQELERVETEGFGALKPIYNFYENTVTNILINDVYGKESKFVNYEFVFNNDKYERLNDKNQYLKNGKEITQKEFNSIQNSVTKQDKKDGKFSDKYYVNSNAFITDEYGNTWNEITLTEKNKEEIYLQKETQSTEKVNKELNVLVQNFLEKIGVSVKSVDEIRNAEGNKLSAVAKADMLNKIIEVIEGKADITTLPEEAAHFFVEMLGENNPLFIEMMSKITGYKIYQDTVQTYRNNSQYRNKDGSLNINKLKKEAIGKLIAQHIVKHSAVGESESKIKEFNNWWDKLLNFIKKLFTKSVTDPFVQSAENILKADISNLSKDNIQETGEYYQLEGIEKLEQHQKDIQLDNSVDPKTKQKRHIYTINGKDIKSSVTSKYVDAWLKRKFPNDNRSEIQKKIDLLKADYGDVIHEMMQDIIDVYVDPETHFVREIPAASSSKYFDTDPYKLFEKYIQDLIENYNAPGTKFMREVKIYDPIKDVAGSIDLLVIEPDGTANIYDWKSQEIGKEQTELKSYKETMYRIQLQEYKKILQTHYDIKNFGLVRAIPIKVVYSYTGKEEKRTIEGINKIEMGSFDLSSIPDNKNYLLPVTLRDEKSADKELSEYIKKLSSVMDILENKKYRTEDERRRKQIELAKYKNAVRDLQLRGDIRKFIDLGNYEINKYKKLIESNNLTEKDALESLEILQVFTNTTRVFNNYMNELKKIKKETKEEYVKEVVDEIINDYNQMNTSADIVLSDMQNAIKNIAFKFSQEKTGIVNLLDAETEISKLTGMFSSLSTIPQKAFRVFSRILGDAQNKRDNLFNKDYEELSTLRKEYVEWARSKGYSDKDLFKPLLDYNAKGEWTGKFLKKYQSEFYKKMQDAVQSEDSIWLIDNTEFNEEKFNKDKIRQKEFYETIVYDSKNERRNKELQEEAYNNWLKKHDVNIGGKNKNKNAYLNMDNYNGKKVLNSYLKPKEKWQTEQWKKLEASPIALKTYNFFQDLLKKSNKAGLIDDYSPAFIPNISRNKLEQFVFGGDMFSKKGIFESLEVESGESPFAPQINPITGAIEHSIPTHFIRDMGIEREDGTLDYSQKSMDLFRVFGIWSAQLANYQSMSEIEDKARLLLFVEKNKPHIETNPFGKPVFESGIKKEIPGNEINSQLLSDFINYYFYNIQSGKMEDKAFKIGDKEYSAHKVLGWMTRFFSLKTLALNPLSGTANFVGGTGNAFFQASKGIIFNTADWTSSIYDITKRNEIAFGLLGVADVLIEDRKEAMINKLSVSSIINANTIDKAFFMMRASDKAVQYPIAIAIMKNHMVDENGKIVDIKTYVKAKYKYNESFYSLPKAEQDVIRKKIEDEVKTLKDTKSIYNTAKIVNDKIEIPGIDLQSEQWGRFRLKIKKVNKNVLGNSSRDDINNIRMGMLGSMAMQFRSWMPQMVQERFGKLKYDQDLEVHTIGKFNLWIGELFSKRAPQLLTGIINSSGTNMIEAAKQKYLLLKAEAIEKGEEFNITEGEFIDMYIGNIKSMYREFLMIIGIGALMFTILSDDDDDDQDVGLRTYAARAFRKYFDEFSFFYSAPSWSNLVNKPLPVVGLADDFFKFTESVVSQGYGFVLNDQDLLEKAKPAKYLSKMMPIFKEGIQIRAIFDDDFRKDWDIRFNTTNR